MKAFFALLILTACFRASAEDALTELLRKYEVAPEKQTETKRSKARKPASTTLARPIKIKKKPPVAPVPVAPPTPPVPAPEAGAEETDYSDFLFGDWGGSRKKLEEKGVDLKIRYKGDVSRNFAGGLKPATVYLGNLDLNGEFDLEKMAGLKGTTIGLYGLGNHGDAISKAVGDSFVTDNIEAPSTFKLYEAYIQQTLDDRFAVLFGLRDLNADFYTTPTSTLFLNNAFGTGPTLSQTGLNGPSVFPVTAIAGTVHYESPEHVFFNAGLFNARAGDHDQPYGTHISSSPSDGYLIISELGAADAKSQRAFKYSVGGWTYTKPVETLDPEKSQGQNWGIYGMADQKVARGTSVFVRYGMAAPALNKIGTSFETGFVFEGLIPSREKDKLGLGFAHLISSGDYQRLNLSKGSESAIESIYKIALGRGLSIAPDAQYIVNPGMAYGVKNAWVGTVRIEVGF